VENSGSTTTARAASPISLSLLLPSLVLLPLLVAASRSAALRALLLPALTAWPLHLCGCSSRNSWPEQNCQPPPPLPPPPLRMLAQCSADQPARCSQVQRRQAALLPSSLLRPLLPLLVLGPPAGAAAGPTPVAASLPLVPPLQPELLLRELFMLLPARQRPPLVASAAVAAV
jgi:hypothetical protein